jgi:hypothetical protein
MRYWSLYENNSIYSESPRFCRIVSCHRCGKILECDDVTKPSILHTLAKPAGRGVKSVSFSQKFHNLLKNLSVLKESGRCLRTSGKSIGYRRDASFSAESISSNAFTEWT